MNKNIVVDIPFNIDLSNYLLPKNYIHPKLEASFIKAQTKEWIDRRMELFMKYAGNSLIHQTNKDFICLLRYTEQTEELIREALSRYPKLPMNIQFTTKADAIIDYLIKQHKNLYRVVIDSDNMYTTDFMDKLHKYKHQPNTQTIMCQEGYLYDEKSKALATVTHPSPSFYAAIYNLETYKELYQKRLFEKHFHAVNYPYEVLEGRNYCICIHEQNVDNEFDTIYRVFKGKMVEDEKDKVLKQLNIL